MVLTKKIADEMLAVAQQLAMHPGVIDVRYYPASIPYLARVAIVVAPDMFPSFSNTPLYSVLFAFAHEPYYRAYLPTDGAINGYAFYSLLTGAYSPGESNRMGR